MAKIQKPQKQALEVESEESEELSPTKVDAKSKASDVDKKWFEDEDSGDESVKSDDSEATYENLERKGDAASDGEDGAQADFADLDQETENEDPSTTFLRVKETLQILGDFRGFQQSQVSRGIPPSEIKSRSSFMQQLTSDCAKYFGYLPELITLFLDLFSPEELVSFLEANEKKRPIIIRTNTLKTSRKQLMEDLTARGVQLQPVDNFTGQEKIGNVGLTVFQSSVPIGATPEYLCGHYILQSASSFLPPLVLRPKSDHKVLDMSSAPGGKTSFLSQIMGRAASGTIVANDVNKKRSKATLANLSRLGCKNVMHVSYDGRDFPRVIGGFDSVLLDAPCSGLGVISRDETVKLSRKVDDIKKRSLLQKQLLLSAIDSLKLEGTVVYSTCSISVEENEMVVQYALESRGVKIEDSGLKEGVGKPGLVRFRKRTFHPRMRLARRMYPHLHNMDGFFVVKLKKTRNLRTEDINVAFGSSLSNKEKKRRKAEKRDSKKKARAA